MENKEDQIRSNGSADRILARSVPFGPTHLWVRVINRHQKYNNNNDDGQPQVSFTNAVDLGSIFAGNHRNYRPI